MKEVLRDLGLSDGEIDVFLSLHEHGESSVSELSHYTGNHRTHIYDVCHKLLDKGFITSLQVDGVQHFRPAPPDNLISYVEEQRNRVESVVEELKGFGGGEKALVESYKGKRGIKAVLCDMLNVGEDFVVFGDLRFEDVLPVFIPQFVRRMDEQGMGERAIIPAEDSIISGEHTEVRFLAKQRLPPTAASVYGDNVAQFVWKKPYYAVRIRDADIASSYRHHFELLWNEAEKR